MYKLTEGQLTLLTHVLHRAPSASSETWSGSCQVLFDCAAGSRDWTYDTTPIIKTDIALEDATRFRLQTAARS